MSVLKTDYKEDVINSDFATERKFLETANEDGTRSYNDVTPYTQEGDEYGAAQINHENTHTNYAIEAADRIYEGVDLTVRFAEEIARYANAWKWIKGRLVAGNFDGLHIGDYIPIYMGDNLIKMQIAGMDTYYRGTDNKLGHHIDWISKDLYPTLIKWTNRANNNGTAEEYSPYLLSNVKAFLDGLVRELPSEVQEVISSKRTLLENRYSKDEIILDSNGWRWLELGKLWIPSEYEVFGNSTWSTPKWSAGLTVQYPIFANSMRNRIKGAGNEGEQAGWWLLTVSSGIDFAACIIANTGHGSYDAISNTARVPICFRVTE